MNHPQDVHGVQVRGTGFLGPGHPRGDPSKLPLEQPHPLDVHVAVARKHPGPKGLRGVLTPDGLFETLEILVHDAQNPLEFLLLAVHELDVVAGFLPPHVRQFACGEVGDGLEVLYNVQQFGLHFKCVAGKFRRFQSFQIL